MLTTKEVSEMLHLSEETVRRWIRNGELDAAKVGKTYLIDEASIKEFIDRKSKEKGNNIFKTARLLDGMATGREGSGTLTEKLSGEAVISESASSWMNSAKGTPEFMAIFQIDHLIIRCDLDKDILECDFHEEMETLKAKYSRRLLAKDKEIAELKIIREQKLIELKSRQ